MKNEILRRLSALALGLALLLNAAPLPQAFAVEDDTVASSSDSADSTDTADKTAVTTADSDPLGHGGCALAQHHGPADQLGCRRQYVDGDRRYRGRQVAGRLRMKEARNVPRLFFAV